MAECIDRAEFIRRIAKRMETDEETAAKWIDAIFDTMYNVFKRGKGITLSVKRLYAEPLCQENRPYDICGVHRDLKYAHYK
ncbi:MAG: HU family DNA-binding protein [Bacillota bacterium]